MSTKKNLIGMRFGTLTVTNDIGKNSEGRLLWLCHCDCGEERVVVGKDLGKKVTRCRSKCTITEDLSGQIFGFVKVMKRVRSDKNGFARFLCRCINPIKNISPEESAQAVECGNEFEVNGISLRASLKNAKRRVPKSCFGCSRKIYGELKSNQNFIDLAGEIFGRLTAIRRYVKGQGNQRRILYECSCACGSGKNSYVRQEALIGKTVRPVRSCGCLRNEHARKTKNNLIHGLTKHPLHNMWCGMKARCEQPTNRAYKWYGERGIKVSEKWNSFSSFYAWAISKEWEAGLSIDRIDNNGPYSPENCQFITRAENALKMQGSYGRAFLLDGRQININELVKKSNVTAAVCKKLLSNGYSKSDILAYGSLKLHQKNAVGRSIRAGNPIEIARALKVRRVTPIRPPQSSEMGSYRAMVARCYRPNDSSYRNYGAKGIGICPEWKNNPTQFIVDMGPKPEPKTKYALDRIDPTKDYFPGNCRWLCASENTRRIYKERKKLSKKNDKNYPRSDSL